MILPLRWICKRPGKLIPVFFLLLSFPEAPAQPAWAETSTMALGGAYLCKVGYSSAALNQACLGACEEYSLCLQHGRPYLLMELGEAGLSAQFPTNKGALGIALFTRGIKGFSQSSLWLAYGMKLHPNMEAGMGIHFWNSSVAEQWLYAYGLSFALGIRIRIHPQVLLGAHVRHPASWTSLSIPGNSPDMHLAAGIAYSFLNTASIYSEIHVHGVHGIILVEAAEWSMRPSVRMSIGFCSKPLSLSWGLAFLQKHWNFQFAFQYRFQSGTIPFISLGHVW